MSTSGDRIIEVLGTFKGTPEATAILEQYFVVREKAKQFIANQRVLHLQRLCEQREELRQKCRAAEETLDFLAYDTHATQSRYGYSDQTALKAAEQRVREAAPRTKYPSQQEITEHQLALRAVEAERQRLAGIDRERNADLENRNMQLQVAQRKLKTLNDELAEQDVGIRNYRQLDLRI